MLTGRVEGVGPDLVRNNRSGWRGLMLLAVLGFGAWQWQQSPAGLVPARHSAAAARPITTAIAIAITTTTEPALRG